MATARSGRVCVTLAPGCRQICRSGSSTDFFRLSGRAWGSGCSLRGQSLSRTAHALGGECGGRRRAVLVATPGVKGERRMTLAHALVYVIDDDLSMRKAIGRLLESEDYSVEMFTGAREFLARAPHTGPSCVILDL